MNLFETLEKLSLEQASEELVDKLLELQTKTVEEQDFEGYFQVAFALYDAYVNLQDFDSAIQTLKTAINSEYTEDYKVLLPLIDKLVGQLIRLEDFHELEGILKMRERFITGDKHQLMMQSFYLSVGFEGMKKYSEAIEVLENIPDNMSSNNIISKYLKLSMLSLHLTRLEKARFYFEKALIYDRNQKNPLFALVESDLLFAEKDYQRSLEKYQEYFIKSKIKNRYLDRYLLLCVQLERYDEALKFYHDYEPKIRATLSKNYQKLFYEAGLSLFEHVYSPGDYEYVRDRVNELRNESVEVLNQFDGIYSLISKVLSKQDIHSSRDLLVYGARSFFELVSVERFHVVYLLDDGYHVLTYHKKLLMEKIYSFVQIQGTIIEKIFSKVLPIHVFHHSDLEEVKDFIGNLPISSEMILASKLYSETYGNMYLLSFLDQTNHYDYIHKLILVLSRLLESSLTRYYLGQKEEEFTMIRAIFEEKLESGLIRIENGIVTMMNPLASKIFEVTEAHFPYEFLRERFVNPRPYLDDFLKKNEWLIETRISPSTSKMLKILVTEKQMVLYLHITDVTDQVLATSNTDQLLIQDMDSSLETMQSLKREFESLDKATSLIYFDLMNREAYYKKYHFSFKKKLNNLLPTLLKTIARATYLGSYRANESGWFLYLDTTDKRVLTRIWNELNKTVNQSGLSLDSIEFEGICTVNQKKRVFEELIDDIYEQYYRRTEGSGLQYTDRKLRSEQHLLRTIQINLEQLLTGKEAPIAYYPIVSWSTQEIHGYQIDLHSSVLLGEKKLLEEAIESGQYAVKIDSLLFKSYLRNVNLSVTVPIFFEIHYETVKNRSVIDDFVRKIKKSPEIEANQFVLEVQLPCSIKTEFRESIEYLKSKGFKIAFKDLTRLLIKDEDIILLADYLVVDTHDCSFVKNLHKSPDLVLIYEHGAETLKKSTLSSNGIHLVKGSLFPALDKPATD